HAGVARRAVLRFPTAHGIRETVETEVGNGVRVKIFPNLLERVCRGNQFRTPRGVDAIETRRDGWRATDAHMHFARSGAAHHPHDFAALRGAHSAVSLYVCA